MTIYYVPVPYTTIQSAINACTASGDIVEIQNDSVYYENVSITNYTNITLRASTNKHPIIDGAGKTNHIIQSNKNQTKIYDVIVRNGALDGINIAGNNCEVKKCTSYNNNNDGIQVNGNSNVIALNVCLHNGHFGEHGIDIDGNSNNIAYNKCKYNLADGINVYGDFNTISNNQCCNNAIDGIDIDGDNGNRTAGATGFGNNVIDSNICELNGADGIENSSLSGAGTPSYGTEIKNNISQFNGTVDYGISRRNPTDPVSQALDDVASVNNISSDGSHDFSQAPKLDSF